MTTISLKDSNKAYCHPIDTKTSSAYNLTLDIFFGISLLINPYVIYCIIFRSTKFMSRYRWYLLYHQLVSFINDIFLSGLTRPVFLLPFPAGYSEGLLRSLISTHYLTMFMTGLIAFTCATVVHLCIFRYIAVCGKASIPLKHRVFMVIIGVLAFTHNPGLCIAWESGTVLQKWSRGSKIYTCITPEILAIENVLAYDHQLMMAYVLPSAVTFIILYLISSTFYLFGSYRVIHTASMSEKLRRLQRNFLLQLFLQGMVPTSFIIIPAIGFLAIVTFEMEGFDFVWRLIVAIVSTFSISSALVLTIMNPTYHDLLIAWFKKRKPGGNHSTPQVISNVG